MKTSILAVLAGMACSKGANSLIIKEPLTTQTGVAASMRIEDFYSNLLDLTPPWSVKAVEYSSEQENVSIHIGHEADARLFCPLCGQRAGATGHSQTKTWRHLDTCQKKTHLSAILPVVNCKNHGQRCVEPPWGSADSPGTFAFEELCFRLARNFGGVKVAARIAGMSPNEIRTMLLASQRRQKAKTAESTPGEPSADSAGEGAQEPQVKQLSLFAQKDMPLINEGIQALKSLDLDKAVELLERHKKLFPRGYDVASKIAMAQFLLDGLRGAPAEPLNRLGYCCGLWKSFEDHARSVGSLQDAIVSKIKTAFFAKLVEETERSGLAETASIREDVPLGYVFLQAGQYERAIQSLQACILEAPDRAIVYGYLGDSYWLRGDRKTARQCYREACFIDPAAIDWNHLQDEELKELKDELLLEYGFDTESAVAWLPSHARITGLFDRKGIRLHEGLKETVDTYLALQKALKREKSPTLEAKLFFVGIIICENEESFKMVKKIDPIQVRKKMQQANPDLFAEFLAKIVAT